MAVSFDPAKRAWTLAVRGLDFADAEKVLDGVKFQSTDSRVEYGEERLVTIRLRRPNGGGRVDLARREGARDLNSEGERS